MSKFMKMFFVAGVIFSLPLRSQAHDVVSLYNSFLAYYKIDYRITKSEQGDDTVTYLRKMRDGDLTHVYEIDRPNGYIELMRGECKCHADWTTVAYFYDAQKNVYLMVNGNAFIKKTMGFYSLKDKVWKDVTEQSFPKITYSLFFSEDAKNQYINPRIQSMIQIYYMIPHKGTTVEVSINSYFFEEILRGFEGTTDDPEMLSKLKISKDDKLIRADIQTFLKIIKYGKIKLLWNMNTGRFDLGEKEIGHGI